MTDAAVPPESAVRAALDRILGSPVLSGSTRQGRLLRHVVERALEGRAEEIKEYVLGVEVFDRGQDFDPRLDTIVRVEARRLRGKLDDYYQGAGAGDPVIIQLKPGSYVPQFEWRPLAQVPAGDPGARSPGPAGLEESPASRTPRASWMVAAAAVAVLGLVAVLAWRPAGQAPGSATPPRLAVLPATHYPADAGAAALADRLTDDVTSELVRLGTLEVVSRTSTRQFAADPRAVRAIAEALDAQWVVELTVHREPDLVRLEARLVDPIRDRKVWVGETPGAESDLRSIARRAAESIGAAVARATR
jgi:TolB-like protein